MSEIFQLKNVLNLSLNSYGHILLSSAIFLSALSSVYLKTMQRERISLLQSLQAENLKIQEKYYQLQIEYDIFSSTASLKQKAKSRGFVDPSTQRRIALLNYNTHSD